MQYLLQDRRIMSVHFQKSIGLGPGVYTTLLHSDESAYLYIYVHGLRQETCSEKLETLERKHSTEE